MLYYDVFKKFSALEGSQHIASLNALKGIEKLVKNNNIKSVFEFGIGIGTIPYLIKSIDPNILYVGTENNDFCIDSFNKNLGELKNTKFYHLKTETDLNFNKKFDLIIVDGSFSDDGFLKRVTHKNSVIFVEGDRKKQREIIKMHFPHALVSQVISNSKNPEWSPFDKNTYIGGYTVYRLNNKSLKNIISFLKEKFATAFRYRIRKLIK